MYGPQCYLAYIHISNSTSECMYLHERVCACMLPICHLKRNHNLPRILSEKLSNQADNIFSLITILVTIESYKYSEILY